MLVDRPEYLKQLFSYKDMDVVKIIAGIRRSGKSTLFELYIEQLKKMGVAPEQIQMIKLEELENESLREYHALHEHIKSHLIQGKKNYVFLDEIQIVEGFGKVVDSLFLKGVDIYLTGSNSKMLSMDLANQIERQKITIHMFPFSFKEYVSAYPRGPIVETADQIFENYLQYSSFPKVLEILRNNLTYSENDKVFTFNTQDQENVNSQVRSYLSDIYDKIVLRDIVSNKNIPDIGRLTDVLRFMADNISKPSSIKRIADTMTSAGRRIDIRTVEKYVDAFCDSFILYKVFRYDIKGMELLRTQNKYFMADMGLRHFILGGKKSDAGKILENVVYLELLRRGYTVNIGKVGDKEVDFVARKGDAVEYYQVSDTIRGEETFKREAASLEAIRDHYPKFILTRDYETASHKGIKIQNMLKWLVE